MRQSATLIVRTGLRPSSKFRHIRSCSYHAAPWSPLHLSSPNFTALHRWAELGVCKPVEKLVFKANSIRTPNKNVTTPTNCVMVTHADSSSLLISLSASVRVCACFGSMRFDMFVCFLLYAISCNYGNNGGLRTTSRTVIASGQGHYNCVCAYGSVRMCLCVAAFNTAYTRWQCKLHACTPEGGGSQTLHTCSLTSNTHGTEVFALRIRTVATHCINCLNLPRNRMTHIHRTIQLNLSNSVWFNQINCCHISWQL